MPPALARAAQVQSRSGVARAAVSGGHPNVQGFARIANAGFGQPQNGYAWTMAWFDGRLYVGTSRNNLCNASIVRRSAWTRQVTACPADEQGYLNLDMRAQIWAYTPQTDSWQRVYISPMVDDPINGHVVRLARDAGYRSMAVYTDSKGITALYVGTSGFGDFAYLLRTVDGLHFQTVGPAGLNVHAESIRALTPFAGRLFVAPIGTGPQYLLSVNHDRVFYSDDPASGKWSPASYSGFGDQANGQLYTMIVYNGQLYAGISNNSGFQIWRTGAAGKGPYKWTGVLVSGGFRGSASPTITAMAVFNGKLYVGSAAETIGASGTKAKGAELIAINPDDTWDLIVGDARQTAEGFKAPLSGMGAGFGNNYNVYLWELAVHDGWLYAGTYNYSVFGLAYSSKIRQRAGFGLWKSRDGTHWMPVSTTGFGNPYNYGVRTMQDTPYGLFLGTANPFAGAPNHQGGAEVWLLANPDVVHPHGIGLSTSPCPMAHCGNNLENNQNITIPTNGASQAWQFSQKGIVFSTALGCATGLRIIVCSGTKSPVSTLDDAGYLFVLDLHGNLMWDSRRLLNSYVGGSVPLLDKDDNIYVSDTNWIISFTQDGVVRWQVPNPAHMVLTSLNMLANGYIVGQAGLAPFGRGLIVVLNPVTGAVAGTLDLTAVVNGLPGEFATPKTISVVGNRIYTVTQFVPSAANTVDTLHNSRLYAIDVDGSGQPHLAWYYAYQGPTGASPVAIAGPQHTTIYFAGTGTTPGTQQDVVMFAVADEGGSGQLAWTNDMTKNFGIPYPPSDPVPGIQAAAAHDPRGGIWVWSELDRRIFHLDETSGQSIETIDVTSLTNDPGALPDGVISIVDNGGKPIMIVGILAGALHLNSVNAIDLSTPGGQLIWSNPVGSGVNAAPYGQFPFALNVDGTPLLVAPISDGTVHAFTLD